MKNKSDFKKLMKLYNKRDEKTKEQYKEYLKGSGVELVTEYLDRIPSIEKKLNIKFPSSYKDYLDTKSCWIVSGKTEDLCIYMEESIYEFNYIGDYKGKSSLDEMHDFLLIGQDYGESSYFVDPYNKLGYGTEAVWKVNRCAIDRRYFELLAPDFYTFVKKCYDFTDNVTEIPFKDYKEPKDYEEIPLNDIYEAKYGNKAEFSKKIELQNEEIKKNFAVIKGKNKRSRITSMELYHEIETCLYKDSLIDNVQFNVFKIIFDNKYSIHPGQVAITTLYGNALSIMNYGEDALSILQNMFVFAFNQYTIFRDDHSIQDYFFVDPHNKLGRGPEAVYIICKEAKSIEEACYVAENIVEFFRLFADEKPINTTPIGKLKG